MNTVPCFLHEKRNDLRTKLILFLISPILGFIYSLKRIKTRSSFIIFFLFAICFGMCFTPEKYYSEIDGQYYQDFFLMNNDNTKEVFVDEFIEYISFNTGQKDYYIDTISFITSRLTDNYHVFFFFLSIIFSFFSLMTFKYFVKEEEFNNSYMCLILCYLFMYISIFNINGARFWTGYWIATYALFKIFRDYNYKFILLLPFAAFCHGTLWILMPIVFVAILTRRFYNMWIIIYILSFFMEQTVFTYINNLNDYLPIFMQNLINSYTAEETILKATAEGTGFWIIGKIFKHIVNIFIFIMVVIIIKNKHNVIYDKRTKDIFTLMLIIMSFSNFTMTVPSLGTRFIVFSYPLIAYIWLLAINNCKGKYSNVLMILPICFFMNIYSTLRYYVGTLNIDFFISSPIYLMVKYLF